MGTELDCGNALVTRDREVSAGCRPTCLSVHVDRHATRPTYRPTRDSADISADISAECRSPYRPIVSTDTRSTDALSTHDPLILGHGAPDQIQIYPDRDTIVQLLPARRLCLFLLYDCLRESLNI